MRLIPVFLTLTLSLFAHIASFSALRGTVTLIDHQGSRNVKMGDTIEVNATIKTAHNAKAQLLFKDKTVVTLGRDSEFKVNDYIFDMKKSKMRVKMHFKKGFFKTITGKIGHIAPKSYIMKTSNSTIGFRGTHLLMKLTEKEEFIACTQGLIEVKILGKEIEVPQDRFIRVISGQAPSKVQILTPRIQQNILKEGFKPLHSNHAAKNGQSQPNKTKKEAQSSEGEKTQEETPIEHIMTELNSDITQDVLLETQSEALPFDINLGTNTQTPIDLFQ